MKIISPISKMILKVFKKQHYVKKNQYKPITYLQHLIVDEGVLLYNLMTCELILITKKDYKLFIDNELKDQNEILYQFLVTHWFLVEENCDEKTFVYLYNNYESSHNLIKEKVNRFVILTTTDCNARCFYCYQLGANRQDMTTKTALDIAKFVEYKCNPSTMVNLHWFGGEPLFNKKVITIICQYLKDQNIKYSSNMITNGYLFDSSTIDDAINIWNLQQVQITLDGTKDIYNKIKAYVNKDPDAFEHVLGNIDHLLKNKIRVSIRLNLSDKNMHDMYNLIDLLHTRYGKYTQYNIFSINAHAIYENVPNNLLIRTNESREKIYNELFKLRDYISNLGLATESKTYITQNARKHNCMADSGSTVLISPEGNLGRCEHYVDSHFYGSIYDESTFNRDYDMVSKFQEVMPDIPECKDCFYYPRCKRLVCCDPMRECFPSIRKDNERKTQIQMLNTYNRYKNNHKDEIDKFIQIGKEEA